MQELLSTAQRECVWPMPDAKLTANDRVLRQLVAREQHCTPMAEYCTRVQREVQPYMRRIVVDWMSDVRGVACKLFALHTSLYCVLRAGVHRCARRCGGAAASRQLPRSISVGRADLPVTAAGASYCVHVAGEQDQNAQAVRRPQALPLH